MPPLFLVPAKGWSVRLPAKNLREIHNVPLFVYSLQHVARSKHYVKERTWVLTESERVVEALDRWGYGQIAYPLEEKEHQDGVIASVERFLEWHPYPEEDVICVVYANCPGRDYNTIDATIAMVDGGCNSVRTYDSHGMETGNVWTFRNGPRSCWYTYTGCVHDDATEIHTEDDLEPVTRVLRDRFFAENRSLF